MLENRLMLWAMYYDDQKISKPHLQVGAY